MKTPTRMIFTSFQGNTTAQLVNQNIAESMSDDTMDMIKQYLFQLSYDKAQRLGISHETLFNPTLLDKLKYNGKNKMLCLVDAKLQDEQLEFFINTIIVIQAALQQNFVVKGLNFNLNPELTDRSLKSILGFITNVKTVKVLSLEKMHLSHQGVQMLFNVLP